VVGWIPFALPRAISLSQTERFDCVITTSPPQSGHLIGAALQRRGIAWVADLRDGWSFEPGGERFPPGRRRRLDARLERAVIASADGLVAVTPPITDDLRQRLHPGAVTITNGFDPADLPAAEAAAASAPVTSGRYSVAYTGTLAYGGASPGPLLEAVRRLRDLDPVGARLELIFAGPTASDEEAELRASDLAGAVRVLGPLARTDALGLQRAADALLVIIDPRRPSIATGKLYEYLSAGRPILVLGEDSVAARIVRDVGAGIVAPHDDPDAIATALRRLITSDNGFRTASRSAVERFSYAELAAQMAEQVEGAIAARGRRALTR
jgi:glycosyltransferase involved in cell wall biosynthesis